MFTRKVWQFWTGDNEITPSRKAGLETMYNLGVDSELLRKSDIEKVANEHGGLHPAYQYLTENHKSDYLRCFWLHHFGGGYADIKHYSRDNNWKECFDMMERNEKLDVIGEADTPSGAAFSAYRIESISSKLVCNSYLIARGGSKFTTLWWNEVNHKLDMKLEHLKRRPARELMENGTDYPLRWAELMGEIFHELCFDLYDTGCISRNLRSGRLFVNYR